MDELIQLIVQKTGLSHELAQQAAETTINFLKTKLPAPLAGQIDSVLSNSGAGGEGSLGQTLGGLFGKKEQ
ncbi:MAG TPA: hypothetical protein VFL96_00720 [Acidobacteriaceae bacterium]|nr:hypothetical protein [Acidobacteriaceae bacterium]